MMKEQIERIRTYSDRSKLWIDKNGDRFIKYLYAGMIGFLIGFMIWGALL